MMSSFGASFRQFGQAFTRILPARSVSAILLLVLFLLRSLALIALLGASIFQIAAQAKAPPAPPAPRSAAAGSYTGSLSCRECHQHFYSLWAPSHHGRAMQPFTSEFSRSNLMTQATDIAVGKKSYRVDLRTGELVETAAEGQKRYSIKHVLGGKNVFYFLTPLERGRLQVLPLAYDIRHREWFDMAGSAVRHLAGAADTALEWRDPAYTFNSACYNCHVSQLSNNYDLATDSYHTTWAEPGINCETCHGPGAEHVRTARALPKGQHLAAPKLIVTSTFNHQQVNSLCASCHAKLYPLAQSFTPGQRFFDHFGLFGLEQTDFYPDGRDLGENFTFTSWRMSRCAQSGQLDCLHCHTSSGRYRFADADANRACLPCHQAQVDNPAQHSHHLAGTEGAKCVACHMPTTEFARMRRSDHSMRPPRPAASLRYSSPNACNLCHRDQDAAWADRQVAQWGLQRKQAPELQRAALIASARKRDWAALPAITQYLTAPKHDEIFAAGLLQLLRGCADANKWPGIFACLKDPSPLVRAAAADACGDELPSQSVPLLLAASRDDYRLVRVRAAAALASVPKEHFSPDDERALSAANRELEASLLARPDDTRSHYNLGNHFADQHQLDKAIAEYKTAVKLQPANVPALANLALAFNATAQNEKAEATLRQALTLEPTNSALNLNLAMLLAEVGELPEAETRFRAAFKADPKSAAAGYNLSILLSKDHPEEALDWSPRAAELRPDEPKYAYTLAYFLVQRGKPSDAIPVLESSLEHGAADADSYGLLGQLFESRGDTAKAAELYRRAAVDAALPQQARGEFAARAQQLSPGGGAPH